MSFLKPVKLSLLCSLGQYMHHKLQPHKSFTNNINTVLKKFFLGCWFTLWTLLNIHADFLGEEGVGVGFLGNGKTHKQGSGLSLGIFVISLTFGELCRFVA